MLLPTCALGLFRSLWDRLFLTVIFGCLFLFRPNLVTARATAWFCGRSLAGTVGSNPARGMDVYLLRVLCVVKYSSLRRVDHLYRGVLPNVMCLSVIVKCR
jgi:hypothetical protein